MSKENRIDELRQLHESRNFEALTLYGESRLVYEIIQEHGISAFFGFWGREVPNEGFVNSTGFVSLNQTPLSHNREMAIREELHVAGFAIQSVLSLQEWESLDVLLVAGSSPPFVHYADYLVENLSLSVSETRNIHLACTSGAYGLFEALTKYAGKKVLILAVDGLTGVGVNGIRTADEIADIDSQHIFSNGIAVMALEPGVNAHHIPIVHQPPCDLLDSQLADGFALSFDHKGVASACHMTYAQQFGQDVDPLKTVRNTLMLNLAPPEGGKFLQMNPEPLTAMVRELLGPLCTRAFEYYYDIYNLSTLHIHIIAHHGSLTLHRILQRDIKKIARNFPGLSIDMPWTNTNGNSSGANVIIELVKRLPTIDPTMPVLIMGFGGGLAASVYFASFGVK